MYFTKTAFYLALLALNDLEQVNAGIWFGSCPTTSNQQNIDVNQYLGRWYEFTRDSTFIFETGSSCTTATYSAGSGGNINVVNRCYYWPMTFTADWVTAKGQASCNAATGACNVGFPNPASTPNYNILYTDYQNTAVVYSCASILWGAMYADQLWVLSRTPTMTDNNYKQVESVIA